MRMQVPSLALLSGLRIWRCLELWCRSQTHLDPTLLWLWSRLAATAPTGPLAWEPLYAVGTALKSQKKKKKKTKKPQKKKKKKKNPKSLKKKKKILPETYQGVWVF